MLVWTILTEWFIVAVINLGLGCGSGGCAGWAKGAGGGKAIGGIAGIILPGIGIGKAIGRGGNPATGGRRRGIIGGIGGLPGTGGMGRGIAGGSGGLRAIFNNTFMFLSFWSTMNYQKICAWR